MRRTPHGTAGFSLGEDVTTLLRGTRTAERYFSDPKRFKPYHLPPPGTLERNAYPFLLMDDRHGALRLGGVSAEFWNLIATLHGTQFQ